MRLVVTRRLPIDPESVVGADLDLAVFPEPRAPTPEELFDLLRGADAVVSLLSDHFDDALLERLPGLRVIANVATGLDNIDVAAATRRGIWVCHTPDVLTEATADLTWALILAVARRLREGERLVREGRFAGWSPTMLLGRELQGAVLGIFGFGRIGQAVARRARAFGMEVQCTSRSPVPESVRVRHAVREVSKEELVSAADVISIHCPLTPQTRHAFDGPTLHRMKPGALLVNTARGPVVDESALVAALQSGHVGGAGLDVFESEPEVHPGLLTRDDVVLLPHLGSATRQARERMARIALADAVAVLRGQRPAHGANEPTSSR